MNPPRNLCNMQILMNKVLDGARDSILLTNSQVVLMLLVWSMGHSKVGPLPSDADEDTEVDRLQVSHRKSGACGTGTIAPISAFPVKATV